MSLRKSKELILFAKLRARELRKTQTHSEEIFWQHVRNRKFHGNKFYRQYPIFVDENGRETFYIADFYCHEYRIAIEIDGKIHERQKEHDRLRTFVMEQRRVNVIRFKNEEIENEIDSVLRKLERYIEEIR